VECFACCLNQLGATSPPDNAIRSSLLDRQRCSLFVGQVSPIVAWACQCCTRCDDRLVDIDALSRDAVPGFTVIRLLASQSAMQFTVANDRDLRLPGLLADRISELGPSTPLSRTWVLPTTTVSASISLAGPLTTDVLPRVESPSNAVRRQTGLHLFISPTCLA
jgi:hypothetical protein